MELKDPIEHHLQRVNALDRRHFLRPMGSSEILERSARIYQLAARQILIQSTLPTLYCFIALIFGFTFLLPGLFGAAQGGTVERDASQFGIALVLTLFLALPLFMFGLGQSFSVAVGAIDDYVTGDRLPGEPPAKIPNPPNPWKFTLLLSSVSFVAFLPIIVTAGFFLGGGLIEGAYPGTPVPAMLAVFGVFSGMAACFLFPFLLIRNALVPIAAIVENKTGKAAAQRGRSLARSSPTTGGMWEALLLGIIITFFVGVGIYFMSQVATSLILGAGPVASWLGTATFGELVKVAIEMVPSYIVLWLLTPFWAALCTTIYYDRRVKLEGYDIRVLARDVLEVRE